MTGSLIRIFAMTMRYVYVLRASWPRVVELIYWPAMQMLVWGFLQLSLTDHRSSLAHVAGTFVGAVLLWDILFRGQLGFSLSFLEEVWSRNIGNLFMSPLHPLELAAALMLISMLRLSVGLIPVTILAAAFFHFKLWTLGFGLLAMLVSLILTSWAIGLAVCGFVLRYGIGAESLAWSFVVLLLPLCCVYYPVYILPDWLQPIAWALSPTYVFEGLRALVIDGIFRADLLARSLGLDVVYLGAGLTIFFWSLRAARRTGALATSGA